MIKIKETEIVDEFTACPYCMCQVSSESIGHCGESSAHYETAYELTNGEVYLASELTIEKE